MTVQQWTDWLVQIPNKEIEGFEEKAHEWAEQFANKNGDYLAESCLLSFFGENPREWMEIAFDTITSSCKSIEEASNLLVQLYTDVASYLKKSCHSEC